MYLAYVRYINSVRSSLPEVYTCSVARDPS